MREFSLLIFYAGQSKPSDLTPPERAAMTALGKAAREYIRHDGSVLLYMTAGTRRSLMLSNVLVQKELGSCIRPQQSQYFDDLPSTCQDLRDDERRNLITLCQETHGRVTPRSLAGVLQAQPPEVRSCIRNHFRRGADELTDILLPLVEDERTFTDHKIIGLAVVHPLCFIEGALRYLGGHREDNLLHNLAEDVLSEGEGHRAIFTLNDSGAVLSCVERIILPAIST